MMDTWTSKLLQIKIGRLHHVEYFVVIARGMKQTDVSAVLLQNIIGAGFNFLSLEFKPNFGFDFFKKTEKEI